MILGTSKKNRKIKLIKFNSDRTLEINNVPIEKNIAVLDKEGFVTKNSGFTEYMPSKFFGLVKPKTLKISGCYVVRENDPAPLEIRESSIYGNSIENEELEYHENESFARAVSTEEEGNDSAVKQLMGSGIMWGFICAGVGLVILVLAGALKSGI
tara:strand:+ start:173 stop:637 length:465 start_codon:yes stop_codon:yes gene_type:complete